VAFVLLQVSESQNGHNNHLVHSNVNIGLCGPSAHDNATEEANERNPLQVELDRLMGSNSPGGIFNKFNTGAGDEPLDDMPLEDNMDWLNEEVRICVSN
jgi:hypothetical protein